jgi:DNA-binding winged helix-turn-helix (wHTH) protein
VNAIFAAMAGIEWSYFATVGLGYCPVHPTSFPAASFPSSCRHAVERSARFEHDSVLMSASAAAKVYSFGPFRLEVAERRLLRDGCVVPLTGKAFDTLQLLVEGAGRLQTQASMIERLWPDVVVEANNLAYNVSLVRRALAGAPGIEIETVRGQGYRLASGVREERPPASSTPAQAQAPDQRMHFAKAPDGARLAYAFVGEGPRSSKRRIG